MSTLDDIIDLTENLEVKIALAVKMFFSDFIVEDICKLLNSFGLFCKQMEDYL